MMLIPLGPRLDRRRVGAKFAALGEVSVRFLVPRAVCLPVERYREALGDKRVGALARLSEDVQASLGWLLTEWEAAVDEVFRDFMLPGWMGEGFSDELRFHFGEPAAGRFAVRSSAITEDSEKESFAGVYVSRLGVSGLEALRSAVVECWRSYYSIAAMTARLRAGQSGADPGMAVIVQRMVTAEIAGIAFTGLQGRDEVEIEFSKGNVEGIVAGLLNPTRVSEGTVDELPDRERVALSNVLETLRHMRSWAGREIDVEWAWDGEAVHVLQMRPLTARMMPVSRDGKAFFSVRPLYGDSRLPDALLGDCRAVYRHYVQKRKWAYDLAAAHGVRTGAARVIVLNQSGLDRHAEEFMRLLAETKPARAIIDLNDAIRQIVVEKGRVASTCVRRLGRTAVRFAASSSAISSPAGAA